MLIFLWMSASAGAVRDRPSAARCERSFVSSSQSFVAGNSIGPTNGLLERSASSATSIKPAFFSSAIDRCASKRRTIRLCANSCRTTGLSGESCPAFFASASASAKRCSSTSTLYSSTSSDSRSSTSTRLLRSRSSCDSICEFFLSSASSARRLPVDSSISRRVRSMRRANCDFAVSGMA